MCAVARRASGTDSAASRSGNVPRQDFEPVGKAGKLDVGSGEGGSETGKAGGRARSEDRLLERPRQVAKRRGGEPAGGQRVLQCSQQRHRRQPARGELEHQAQKHAGWRAVQRQTRRIVDLDAPAAQFGRHSAGKFAVGGDERGGGPGGFELAPEQQSNRQRLFMRAGAIVAAEPGERFGGQRSQIAPGIGRRRRPHRLADELHPLGAR